MNITHVSFGFHTGGTELMMIDIMACQARAGHKVSLVLINDDADPALLQRIPPEVKVVKVGRPAGSKNPLYLLRYNRQLRSLRPDVVHFHQSQASSYTIPSRRTRYVETIHCLNAPTQPRKYVSRRFAISQGVQANVKQRTGLDTELVPNGITTECILAKAPACDASGARPCAPFRMVIVGRLDHANKGQDIAMRALAQLLRDKPGIDASLDLIGEGASLPMLTSLARELGIEDRVKFLGNRSREYVYEHLRDYDLFILPSRYEGFGLTVAEAMAAKLPVLVCDLEGPAEVVAEGRAGTMFHCGDSADCARAMGEIIADYPARELTAQTEAYTRVRECYDVEATARHYLAAYAEITGK